MARPEIDRCRRLPRAGLRRRRRRVRRARLRRRQHRPHRPRRAPEQGDDLLPLQEQGRALPRDPARHVRRRPDARSPTVAASDARARGQDPRATSRRSPREAEARPHFPPIWLREIAEGGAHVDAATLDYVRDVLAALGGIIDEGRRARRAFSPCNPLLRAGRHHRAADVLSRDRAACAQKIERAAGAGVARRLRATWSSRTSSGSRSPSSKERSHDEPILPDAWPFS